MESTSASLLERVRHRDDTHSWARFVALYTPVLYHWTRRLGLQEADACDVVQDVFAILVNKLSEFRYDAGRSFRAWLKQVALNVVRMRHRRGVEQQLPDGDGRSLEDSDESRQFWEVEFRGEVMRRALSIMQRDFAPATWQACWAVVVEGASAAAVADQLGISVGSVYVARCRVLQRLREELAGLLE